MDYKALLKKYMQGVAYAEGVYFEDSCKCSSEEREILKLIIRELELECELYKAKELCDDKERKLYHQAVALQDSHQIAESQINLTKEN